MPRLRPADSLDADGLRPEGAAVLGVRGEAQGGMQVKTDNTQSIAALEALGSAVIAYPDADIYTCCERAISTLRATHAAQPEPVQPRDARCPSTNEAGVRCERPFGHDKAHVEGALPDWPHWRTAWADGPLQPPQPAREPDAVWTLKQMANGLFLNYGNGTGATVLPGDMANTHAAFAPLLGNRRSVKLHVTIVED